MRLFSIAFFIAVFSILSCIVQAQDVTGTAISAVKNVPPKEIPKPLREDRLNELLPIIRGIYSNTNRYRVQRNGFGVDRTYSYFENPKPSPEETISFQNLDDIATVIDFLQRRKATSNYSEDGPTLPNASTERGFSQLWPDDINFVFGSGLRGCDGFCKKLLIDREFASITVLETEILEEGSDPQPVKATRYRFDDAKCRRAKDGHHLLEGEGKTHNLPKSSVAFVRPASSICFGNETVKLPETGAFVYFNHASPFWPDEFERALTRIEPVPDPLRAITRTIHPKAFEDLETEFDLSFILHLAYEFRTEGVETKTVFAFESACINPKLPLDETSLNLLVSTHDGSENLGNFIGYPVSIFVKNLSGICTGKNRSDDTRLPSFTKEQKAVFGKLYTNPPTQAQIDSLVPTYEAMFDDVNTAHLALKEIQKLPEGSLAGHIKTLNKIRDKIAAKAGCESAGCDGRYYRVYDTAPTVRISQSPYGGGHWVPKTEEDQWVQLAADGATIYAAAGPKAVKHLEAAHKKGLGGAVYTLGCIGTSSELIEELALQAVRSTRMYPQPAVRHFLSIRHSPKADQYKEEFKKQKRVGSYHNALNRALLAWDNQTTLCRYRNDI